MTPCPSETTLRLIGTDFMGDATFEEVERHVEECDSCRLKLERFVKLGAGKGNSSDGSADPLVLPSIPGFVIERELGRGSSGVVYLAHEPGLDREVALKIIPGGTLAGPRGRAKWMAEARAVSRLRHPNVVRLYRVDETADWLVLVFEYIPGGTLKERLKRPISSEQAGRLMETVALAVHHIHERGLLHLDLKPSNILLEGEPNAETTDLTPKVSDFGISRDSLSPFATLTSLIGPRGTPSYMAPEQAASRTEEFDARTDIHALGAVLYHMLTGRPPFLSENVIDAIDRIRHEVPTPPSKLNKDVAPALEAICLKCLKKQPNDRYQTAAALADDLRAWSERRPTSIRPRPLGFHRPALTGLVLIALSLAGFGLARGRFPVTFGRPISSTELRDWITRTHLQPRQNEPDTVRRYLQATRQETKALCADPNSSIESIATLATLTRGLCDKLRYSNEYEEFSAAFLDQSITLFQEALRRRPHDQELTWELCETYLCSNTQDIFYDAFRRHYQEAVNLAFELEPPIRRLKIMMRASDAIRLRASYFLAEGDFEKAKALLQDDQELLERLPSDNADAIDTRARLIVNQAMREPNRTGVDVFLPVIATSPSQWSLPESRSDILQECVGCRFLSLIFSDQSTLPALPDGEARESDSSAISRLYRDFRRIGFTDDSILNSLSGGLSRVSTIVSANWRSQGNLRDAERVERRFLAVAREMVALRPERYEAQILLSEAYVQCSKNSWKKSQDDQAIEFIRLSRDAAHKAAILAPRRPETRLLVEDRDLRLARALRR